jgi:hypothetical protein
MPALENYSEEGERSFICLPDNPSRLLPVNDLIFSSG